MFKSSGTIRYYDSWWAVIYVSEDISKYYSKLLYMDSYIKLNKTKYPAHISVIYKEEPVKDKELWGYNDGEEIEFDYSNNVCYDGGLSYWIEVECKEIETIIKYCSVR